MAFQTTAGTEPGRAVDNVGVVNGVLVGEV